MEEENLSSLVSELELKLGSTTKHPDCIRPISKLSHELLLPLTGISGLAEVLDNEILTPDQKECVAEIKQSALQLHLVITKLLEILAAGSRMPIKPIK